MCAEYVSVILNAVIVHFLCLCSSYRPGGGIMFTVVHLSVCTWVWASVPGRAILQLGCRRFLVGDIVKCCLSLICSGVNVTVVSKSLCQWVWKARIGFAAQRRVCRRSVSTTHGNVAAWNGCQWSHIGTQGTRITVQVFCCLRYKYMLMSKCKLNVCKYVALDIYWIHLSHCK